MNVPRPNGVPRHRSLARVLACVALGLVLPAVSTVHAATVSGPVTGGTRGRPFTSAVVDLAAHGYVEIEQDLRPQAQPLRSPRSCARKFSARPS
jgi:hypothetical protein